MNYCKIKDTQKAQTLQQMSGLSEFSVNSFIKGFQKINGEESFPELDEIPYANSEEYLNRQLDIQSTKNSKYTTIDKLKEVTGGNVEEATVSINREYSDLEVHLNQIGKSVIVETLHRPSEYNDKEFEEKSIDFDNSRESNSLVLRNALDRLQKYYGIKMIPITKSELSNPEFNGLPVSEAHAFILNGNIYVNTDVASVDAPIHEQLHLFLGSIRFGNPTLYYQLVQNTELLPNFSTLAREFPGRTMSDIQEEIFVNELAKHITGQPSMFDSVDPFTVNRIMYNIKRDIDSIVFGKQSVKSLSSIFEKSLLQLAEELNSDNFDIDTLGTLDDATVHRIMANTKEELMNKNELIQECS